MNSEFSPTENQTTHKKGFCIPVHAQQHSRVKGRKLNFNSATPDDVLGSDGNMLLSGTPSNQLIKTKYMMKA